MDATKIKKVIYDSQGMLKAAAEHFDWLLVLDEALVQKFFIAMAVEQPDGSLLLPESIRSKVAVEVVWEAMKPMPSFDSPVDESAIPSDGNNLHEPFQIDEERLLSDAPAWDFDKGIFFDEIGTEHKPVFAIDKSSESGEFVLEQATD